jgi:hypothetical protein
MSLNLGTAAFEAMNRLAGSEDWRVIVRAVHDKAQQTMNAALEAPGDRVVDNVGYARAVRDLYLFCEAATTGQPIQKITKPGPVKS